MWGAFPICRPLASLGRSCAANPRPNYSLSCWRTPSNYLQPRPEAGRALPEARTRAHHRADNGTVLIPAYSVGRTQELLYELKDIIHSKKLDTAATPESRVGADHAREDLEATANAPS